MMTYSEREIEEGLLWVRLATGSEVYGALTIIEKREFNDVDDVARLCARFESGGKDQCITAWGFV